MIKIAVVDDDELMLKQINELLNKCFSETLSIQLFNDGNSFLEKIDDNQYDLVFLDIDMPNINGFNVAKRLNEVCTSNIIFVSNLEHLVFEAFDYKPLRFVRKSCLESDIQSVVKSYTYETKTNNVYYVRTNDGEFAIPINDILFFESFKHDIYVQTTKDKLKIKREHSDENTISSLYEKFENIGFIRIHKSYIVNYRYIYMINRKKVILKNDYEIYINPRNANDIKAAYQYYVMMEG